MKITRKIAMWILDYQERFFDKPKYVQITREERQDVMRENCYSFQQIALTERAKVEQIFSAQAVLSQYGDLARARTIEMPIGQYVAQVAIDKQHLNVNIRDTEKFITQSLVREIVAYINQDVTKITIEVQHDPWALLKKLLHITRWFPIKISKFDIDGRVIYPYLNVQLPNHIHTVKLDVTK